MAKKKETLGLIKFVETGDLQDRFAFVDNETLKANIAIKMKHIVFLVSLEEEYDLPGAITYSVFKTVIIYTASIIESLVHFKLRQLINEGRAEESKMMGNEKKYSNWNKLYEISRLEKVFGVVETLKPKKLNSNTSFRDLNKVSKKVGLFDENLFEKSEEIRELRNRIHLYSLKDVDDQYSKNDIADIFSMTGELVDRVETY